MEWWDQGSARGLWALGQRSSVPSILFPFPSLTGSRMGNWACWVAHSLQRRGTCRQLQRLTDAAPWTEVSQSQILGPVRTWEPTPFSSEATPHYSATSAHSYSLQNRCIYPVSPKVDVWKHETALALLCSSQPPRVDPVRVLRDAWTRFQRPFRDQPLLIGHFSSRPTSEIAGTPLIGQAAQGPADPR